MIPMFIIIACICLVMYKIIFSTFGDGSFAYETVCITQQHRG